MNITAIIINGIAVAALILAFIKDKNKAVQSLKMALKSFIKMLPMVFIIIIAIGLLLGFVPPDQISRFVGEQSGASGVIVLFAVVHFPEFLIVGFPASRRSFPQ